VYVVSRRHLAQKQMCKQATVQQPLLGNSSVDTVEEKLVAGPKGVPDTKTLAD
jgi:hypothetical protein